jgi:hypothetical protein
VTYNVGDPGHVKAHSDLVGMVNTELTRFGLGDLLPIKAEGDEGHLDDHNAIRAKLDSLATLAGQAFSTPLPPVRSLGDGSHTDDHNTLAACASEVATWPAWNAASGGLEQSIGDYNGWGSRWMVHTFTTSGTLTITRAAQDFRVLLVGAGGNGGSSVDNCCDSNLMNGGAGGRGGNYYFHDEARIEADTYAVTVGTSSGAASSFGDFTTADAINTVPGQPGIATIGGAGGTGPGGGGGVGRPGTGALDSNISGASAQYAGGGGGGAFRRGNGDCQGGGAGKYGGGNGGGACSNCCMVGSASAGAAGAAGTGGGGGGGGITDQQKTGSRGGGAGGSGVVIVAYRQA